MIRFGLGVLVATTACAALGVAACGDTIQGAPPSGGGGASTGGAANTGGGTSPGGTSTNGGSSGAPTTPTACVGECCPDPTTNASCYSDTDPTKQWGAECQATRDNTGQDHIQMRQAWIRATTPVGNTSPVVYGVLAGRTELPAAQCNQGGDVTFGDGGYIQLIDFYLGGSKKDPTDFSKDYSTVGYSRFVTKDTLADSLTNGFCNGTEVEHATPKYALSTAAITPSDLTTLAGGFPDGLQPPMGALDGWNVTFTKAQRIAKDFVVKDDRLTMLKDIKAGKYGAGVGGVFYYDPVKGYAHGFGALGWTVVYTADHKTHISIPIREVETKSTFNDPTHPDCVGAYRGDKLSKADGCHSTDPKDPAWGCLKDSCPGGEGPAETDGYFLISELDQIYTGDLLSTLCVSYPGKDAAGKPAVGTDFYNTADASCRGPKWDPKLPKGAGIPMGDWCAATNSVATADCHDAFHSHSFHVFVGGKIKVDADPTKPLPTCQFSP